MSAAKTSTRLLGARRRESANKELVRLGRVGPGNGALRVNLQTGRHRGFGFVNYERREDVDKVLQSGPHYMDGQMVRIGCGAYEGPLLLFPP
jgi:hypothetical protein